MFKRLSQLKVAQRYRVSLRNYVKPPTPPNRIPKNGQDSELLKNVEEAIRTNTVKRQKLPWLTRIGVIMVPTVLLVTGIFSYNTYHGQETFIPLVFRKKILISEQNSYGINLEKLKDLTTARLIQKLSINHTFQTVVGLPIVSQEMDKFEVYLQYKNLVSYGIQIDLKKKPFIQWVSREYSINQERLNEFLEPMGIADLDYKFSMATDVEEPMKDYQIVIEGRLKVGGNVLFKTSSSDCDVNFRGVIDFDHSQNIGFDQTVLIHKDSNNNVEVIKLW